MQLIDLHPTWIKVRKKKLNSVNCCPLIRMNHSRSLNKRINKLHERALRLIFPNHTITFQVLLNKDDSVTVHQSNIQTLAILMYKVKHNFAPVERFFPCQMFHTI